MRRPSGKLKVTFGAPKLWGSDICYRSLWPSGRLPATAEGHFPMPRLLLVESDPFLQRTLQKLFPPKATLCPGLHGAGGTCRRSWWNHSI